MRFFLAPNAPSHISYSQPEFLTSHTSHATLGPLALARPLGTSGLHLLLREAAHVTTGSGITALGVTLLTTEAEFLVSLLALEVGTALTAATLAVSWARLLDGHIEEVLGIVGRSRSISLALCKILLANVTVYSELARLEYGETYSSSGC